MELTVFTEISVITILTYTLVVVGAVEADSAILTRRAETFIDV